MKFNSSKLFKHKNRIFKFILNITIITIIVTILWSWTFDRLTLSSWKIPIHYEGDGIFVITAAKAYSEGDISLLGSKQFKKLNAPYGAIMDDWPIVEGTLYYGMGHLARIVGPFASINIVFLLASVLASWSFYATAKLLKIKPAFCFSLAISFAFAPLLFYRLSGHITIDYYWHIPLILLFIYKTVHADNNQTGWSLAIAAIFLGIVTGLQNPYYTWMSSQLCVIVIIGMFFNRMGRKSFPLIVFLCFAFFAFLMANSGSIEYRLFNGPNPGAVERHLVELDIHGLRIPSLFVPPVNYRLPFLAQWSKTHYYNLMTVGEMSAPYLGILGIIGFVVIVTQSLKRLLNHRKAKAGLSFLGLLWILAYSVCGGIGLLTGVFGLILFRGGNRFSIFILALCLIALGRFFSKKFPKKWQLPAAALIIIVVFLDQMPLQTSQARESAIESRFKSDENLVRQMEQNLPKNAMIFQLPVSGGVETPPLANMLPYEHYTPYTHSKTLRWSFGAVHGRGIDDWQARLQKKSPKEIVDLLEKYGFSAIYISRRGYLDNGNNIVEEFRKAGLTNEIESDNKDIVVFLLNPSRSHETPPLGISLGNSFWGWEKNDLHSWSWAQQAAGLEIYNPTSTAKNIEISFGLGTLKPGSIDITVSNKIAQYNLDPKGLVPVTLKLSLQPGNNKINFKASMPAQRPNDSDPRKISFGIFDVKLIQDGKLFECP